MNTIEKTLQDAKFLIDVAGIKFRNRWEYIETNQFGGDLYKKGEKSLLIFPYRAFMWCPGKDSIIREITNTRP